MAVSQTRIPTRGFSPPFSREEKRLLVLRQGVGPGFSPGALFLAENIPDTPRGVDELGVAGVALDLLAQVADMYVNRSLVAKLVAPHPAQERAPREHPAGARGERNQQLELSVGEVYLFAPHGYPAAGEVDSQPVVVKLVGTLARRNRDPAHYRPHARDQLS